MCNGASMVVLKGQRENIGKTNHINTIKVKELPKFKTLNDHKQVSNTLYILQILTE